MSEPNPATEAPTAAPTEAPTQAPTEAPTQAPTEAPTAAPTQAPTEAPKSYVYLNPNIWNVGAGERYDLYVWGTGVTAKWITATKISDSKYQFEIPDGYTGGLFVRAKSTWTPGDWNSTDKWNQTEDLTITGNIGKTYTVNSWNGGTDGKSKGTWA